MKPDKSKPDVKDPNGGCFEFTESFYFTGKNYYNETKEITNGKFNMRDHVL